LADVIKNRPKAAAGAGRLYFQIHNFHSLRSSTVHTETPLPIKINFDMILRT